MYDRRSASVGVEQSFVPAESDQDHASPQAVLSSGSVVSLMPFLNLARELAVLFVPLHLRDEFRAELSRDLVAAARQRYARDLLLFPAPDSEPGRMPRRWIWGAATLGSAVSLAGLVALVWYQRRRQAA